MKGGLFGIRRFKTKRNNKENCRRFTKKYYDTHESLIRKYNCDQYPKHPECKKFEYPAHSNQTLQLGVYCNDEYTNYYDYSRDGMRVKKRTADFIDSPVPPPKELFEPWAFYPYFYHHENDTYSMAPL